MSAWGTAAFSDDAACDVRDSYIDLLDDGLSGHDATKKLVGAWSKLLEDPDEAPVFWLALAATQWKYGRLEPHVLKKALSANGVPPGSRCDCSLSRAGDRPPSDPEWHGPLLQRAFRGWRWPPGFDRARL